MGLFETKNITIQSEKAAKVQSKGEIKAAKLQAKSNEKIAKMQKNQNDHFTESAKIHAKSRENIEKMRIKQKENEAKREIIREKKLNQEGIYKKIGPFTIKFYLIAAAIIFFLIFTLVTKDKDKDSSKQFIQNSTELTE